MSLNPNVLKWAFFGNVCSKNPTIYFYKKCFNTLAACVMVYWISGKFYEPDFFDLKWCKIVFNWTCFSTLFFSIACFYIYVILSYLLEKLQCITLVVPVLLLYRIVCSIVMYVGMYVYYQRSHNHSAWVPRS